MCKVIFKAIKFLNEDEINVVAYSNDDYVRSWVDRCDGKEVTMLDDTVGIIKSSNGYEAVVHIDWCEEVIM